MSSDVKRGLTFQHKAPKRGERNKRHGAGSICSLFVGFSVGPRDSASRFIFGDDFKTTRLMSQKNVLDFLHQGRVCPHATVIRIQYYVSSADRQGARTSA